MPQYLSPGVYVEEMEAGSRPIEGVGTAIAAFVGVAQIGPFNTPTLVTNWSQFTNTFGDFAEGSYLAHAVYGYFQNGGGAAYVVRVGDEGAAPVPSARAELASAGEQSEPAYRVTAREPGELGNDLSVEISHPDGDDAPDDRFTMVVKRGPDVVETFDDLSTRRGRESVVTVVNARSTLIRVEEVAGGSVAERRPVPGTQQLSGGSRSSAPARISPDEYVGDTADRTGFGGLEAIDDITMVVVPDVMAAYQRGLMDAEGVKAVQLAMIAHCEQMGDRIAVLDPPPGLNAQQIKEWRLDAAGYDSRFAALYWPWVKVFDPATGENIYVPPAGHMAGVWGRNDATRGVHKAPANEVVRGAVEVELNISRAEHDLLNPNGINVIRSFPGRGIRVWGARTLSSDPAWRYINVRRLFNYVEGSILNGTNWVVFEPNDMDLWGRIRRTISAFLYRVWLDGALFGATPEQAFYVKCDAETNPQEVIEAGQVVCEVGIAPVKPAEFVVFRLAQLPSGTSAVNE
jgi:phage tail sheath protein FI